MESKIIELLSIKKNNNLGVKEIAGILGEDKEEVHNTLRLLGKEGIVYKNNNDKYILVSNTSLKKGTIKITSRIGVKKIKYSLIVGLLSDLISIILSVVIVTLIFGN